MALHPNDLEAMRSRELERLDVARKMCTHIAQDRKQDNKSREHAERLISRIDALRRRLGATDVHK